jgi:hypothetical protein
MRMSTPWFRDRARPRPIGPDEKWFTGDGVAQQTGETGGILDAAGDGEQDQKEGYR